MTVGEIIFNRRKELGLTLEEIGKATGVSKSTVKKWENGFIANMRKDKIEFLAKALNIDPLVLIQGIPKCGNQLNSARTHYKLSLSQLSKHTGISEKKLSDYEEDIAEPTMQELSSIAEAYGITQGELLWNDFKENTSKLSANANPNAELISAGDGIYKIPVFNSVSAGFGAYACSDVIDYMPLYIQNPSDVPDMLCIKVTGDSMYPKIEDGDIIVVRRQDSVDSGSIAVVLVDEDQGYVKKVIYDEKTIELHSINPEYAPKIFRGAEVLRVRVVGIVKQVIKTL